MNDKAFLDTNLFVYMQSSSDYMKKEASYRALENYSCIVSTQVINEFSNVALKKLGMKPGQVKQILHAIDNTCEIAVVTLVTIESALNLKDRYGFSYYDSLIISSALENGCSFLFSEDLSDGQVIDNSLEIVNIFKRPDFQGAENFF